METQAGGVRGFGVEISSARTPPSIKSLRNGIWPSSISGSRMVKVAPSKPIKTVVLISITLSIAS
jgi:hypothetical protein